jgi:hypothetical protein
MFFAEIVPFLVLTLAGAPSWIPSALVFSNTKLPLLLILDASETQYCLALNWA